MMSLSSDHPLSATRGKDRAASKADDGKEPLQIRIPTAIKRRFKAHAALLGLESNQLFVKMWDHYEATRAEAIQESPEA